MTITNTYTNDSVDKLIVAGTRALNALAYYLEQRAVPTETQSFVVETSATGQIVAKPLLICSKSGGIYRKIS